MKHYGDITKLNGHDLPVVDVLTGGSPCQDLSVAGKRAGLAGERSGLFMEQIRLFKELREYDRANRGSDVDIRLLRPRYFVWENVPGALSSPGGDKKGEDFRCVLEEVCRIADKAAVIPKPQGGWSTSGCIMGDWWSVAWRVHDAQFWGVPQRRKRIALIADFGGDTAPKILFESESLSGDIAESGKEGQGAATNVKSDIEEASGFNGWQSVTASMPIIDNGTPPIEATMPPYVFEPGAMSRVGGHAYEDVAGTIRANAGDNQQAVVYGISSYDSNAMKSDNPHSGIYEAETARTLDLNGGSPACNQGGMAVVCATTEMTPKTDEEGVSFSLRSRDYKDPQIVCIKGENISNALVSSLANAPIGTMKDSLNVVQTYQKTTGSLCASGYDKLGTQEAMNDMYVVQSSWDGSQTSPTLTANNAGGGQRMPDKENFNAVITYGLDRASFNQGQNAQYDFSIEEEKAQTIVAKGPGGVLTKQ